jgi:hypothetical protein
MMIFLGCSILMTLGWGEMTSVLVFASGNSRGASTSRGRAVSVQVLNKRNQEAVMLSTSDLHSGEDRAVLKVTVSSSGDRQRKVKWPRKRTPVGRGHDEEENMECNAFHEPIKMMAEEMELKWASWGGVCPTEECGPSRPLQSNGMK